MPCLCRRTTGRTSPGLSRVVSEFADHASRAQYRYKHIHSVYHDVVVCSCRILCQYAHAPCRPQMRNACTDPGFICAHLTISKCGAHVSRRELAFWRRFLAAADDSLVSDEEPRSIDCEFGRVLPSLCHWIKETNDAKRELIYTGMTCDSDLQDSTSATFEGCGLFDDDTSIASSLMCQ